MDPGRENNLQAPDSLNQGNGVIAESQQSIAIHHLGERNGT